MTADPGDTDAVIVVTAVTTVTGVVRRRVDSLCRDRRDRRDRRSTVTAATAVTSGPGDADAVSAVNLKTM